jgi:hypothetical protein
MMRPEAGTRSRWFTGLLAAAVVAGCGAAVERAVYSGNAPEVRQFLDEGLDVNQGGGALFRLAVEGGHVDVARLFLERGADVNARNASGGTALMVAAAFGHVDIVKLLLPRVTDINATDEKKETALYKAVNENHVDVVRILLAAGADPAVGEVWTLPEQAGRWDLAKKLRAARTAPGAPAGTELPGDAGL